MDNNDLKHWGIKGMKWGVRRYQNADGSLTLAGRYHQHKLNKKRKAALEKARETRAANKAAAEARAKKIASGRMPAKKMTDKELEDSKKRLQAEKEYNDLLRQTRQSSRGQKFLNRVLDSTADKIADHVVADVASQTAKTVGVKAVNALLKDMGYGDETIFTNNKRKS